METIMTSDEPDQTTPGFAAKIAAQNDAFRKNIFLQSHGPNIPHGKLVCTRGISAKGKDFRQELLLKLYNFDEFDEECDPNDWHDMGVLEVGGEKVWFKFDFFDTSFEFGSEDPSDIQKTRRVLTLMFPNEY